ncbi:MAG: S8 family serine peptidase [Burkholderiaceae bacterium]|nr:S8 family serine peptidase [Burkholderiaceae bacterium]
MDLLLPRLLAGLGLAVTTLAAPAAPAVSTAPTVTGFIVQLREDSGDGLRRAQSVQAVLSEQRLPLTLDRELGQRWHALAPTTALDTTAARAMEARLRADPRVARVVPNVREQRLDVTPSDARFAEQWWLKAVAAGNSGAAGFAKAWDRSTGVANAAPVAVLDSGLTSHIELNARVLPGYDFVADAVYSGDGNGRDADYQDPGDAISASDRAAHPAAFSGCPETPASSWHGTSIAGQLAAVSNNTEGVAAANWQGTVLPVRVAGKCGAAVADIIDGLRWAAGLAVAGVPANPNPARLIVLSYGSIDACDVNSSDAAVRDTAQLYVDTLAAVRARGSVVFVAAGNQRREVGRPASCSGAFAVAAANREGIKSSYSNFGAKVALLATGGDAAIGASCDAQLADSGIVTTGNLGQTLPGQAGYVAASGTSFAAPQAAAVASLMLGLNPSLTVEQIEDGLKRSARPHVQSPLLGDCALGSNVGRCSCTTATCGAGLLDADQALAFAQAPATWQAPTCSATVLVDDRHAACATVLGRSLPDPLPAAVAGSCQPAVVTPTNPTNPTNPTTPSTGGGGGGGALGLGWLAGLALAVWVLRALRRPTVSG